MGKVGIVTDSAGDLSIEQLVEKGIRVVPLKVRIDDKEYIDVTELSAATFWELTQNSHELPQTSAPSIGEFEMTFRTMASEGTDQILCITLSSELSATYQSAMAAAKRVSPDITVSVIDSRYVSLAEGFLAMKAADLADQGLSLEEVVAEIRAYGSRILVYGTLDTLDNLKRGGRIGAAQALFGSLLSFKPVIEVKDGLVLPESRQRTRSRALAYLLEKVSQNGPYAWVGVMQALAPETEEFVQQVAARSGLETVYLTTIGPIIGTHAGIRTVGLTLVKA